ncbi:MAG: hypothetical protein A2383_01530 [Candidatus Pacebacteria bacterium RIFOXYB1_FULL_39_46]|nr:MAG: hypothetical protein A2383_01530 [Candidatus Pacebacteria bacterium RIFOXYB1_FULL_39_46]OGJ39069.1 MAG: hypothetical protein A2182_01950 [Candidatus Pacebacteria bacterium RIFOXYA1_FULL_38_18]OGJ39586.1 MAG: hypothetical protein A2582_01810 [Candidatus Pacebacteria bacterium RIFOXYD1_FULL_39_27]OGJ40698.1 MAG: hypothetical protein A2411_00220 [Candidatus Pacebacteria bacterium RIFOXYC1_FULL_39_21]
MEDKELRRKLGPAWAWVIVATMTNIIMVAIVVWASSTSTPTTPTPVSTETEEAPDQSATIVALLEELVAAQAATEEPEAPPTAEPTPEPVELVVPPTAEPTPEPTQASTEEPELKVAATEPSVPVAENGYPIVSYDWGRANIPAEVTTIKVNDTGGCNMPDVVCYMLDDEGVLGADDLAEAEANPSAIWTGSAWHQMAQGPQVGLLVPEGSYATWYSISSTVDGGGYHLEFAPQGELQCSGVLVRGWFAETHVDRHVPIVISNYGALGAMVYTRYPVPVEAGQFFSQDYLTAQATNALDFDNSGIGDEDCDLFWQFVFDYNDGSLTVLNYTVENGWSVVWTNIVGHGR